MGYANDDGPVEGPVLEERALRSARTIEGSGRTAGRGDSPPRWCPGCGLYTLLQALEIFLADRGGDAGPILVTGPGCLEDFRDCLSAPCLGAPAGSVWEAARGVALEAGRPVLALMAEETEGPSLPVDREAGGERGVRIGLLPGPGPAEAAAPAEPGNAPAAEPAGLAAVLSDLAGCKSPSVLRFGLKCPKRP